MYGGYPCDSMGDRIASEPYFKSAEDFRKRIKDVDSKVLERYKSFLKPKKFLEHLCFSFYFDRAMKFHITSNVLEKRALSDKNKSD